MRALVLSGLILATLAACQTTGGRTITGIYLQACSDPKSTPAEALQNCQFALRDPALSPEQRALVYLNIGVANFGLGRYRDAVIAHGEALAINPRLTAALTGRAQAHEALGDTRAALADFGQAIELSPRTPEPWFGRGALLRRIGRPGEARLDLDRALRLRSNWTAARFERGGALFELGLFREAANDFGVVVSREPENAEAVLNRGQARFLGNLRGAGDDFDRAIAIAPEWPLAYATRAAWHDASGRREAANADFARAYELGSTDPAVAARVRGLTGG
jgi:tetratricopeptide (TPR) repeat protein